MVNASLHRLTNESNTNHHPKAYAKLQLRLSPLVNWITEKYSE